MSKRNNSSEEYVRVEFSSKERSRITSTFFKMLTDSGKTEAHFEASKSGHKYKLTWNPLAVEAHVIWHVCIDRKWRTGNVTTVVEGLERIAGAIMNKEWYRRLDNPPEDE